MLKIPSSVLLVARMQRSGHKNIRSGFVNEIIGEYEQIKKYLPDKCESILDIGCGLGAIDVLLYKHYVRCKLNMVDMDFLDPNPTYGYDRNKSYYNLFSLTDKVLRTNGIDTKNDCYMINAKNGKELPEMEKQDLILSILSCGYHYPVNVYIEEISENIKDKGLLIIDLREISYEEQIKDIRKYFKYIDVLRTENKAKRIVASKSPIEKKEDIIPDKRWNCILSKIAKDRKIIGAEIGILNGNTSHRLLKKRPELTLIMVDPWKVPDVNSAYWKSKDINAFKTQKAHDKAYKLTIQHVEFAKDRARIYKMTSVEAVKLVKDNSLDFVFIDGDHSYKGCLYDIRMWYPKLKDKAWIGGHDYAHPNFSGVKKAVDFMFDKEIYNIELGANRTWFVEIEK